jgi:hypothetical protein
MISVEVHLKDLISQLHSTTREIKCVIGFLNNASLTGNEKMHQVANLMLVLDLKLLDNRKHFDQIRMELRDINL